MVWRNSEHYPDPTAGADFQRIAREEARNEMNEGKRFERDFKASVPPDAWCYRLRDSPISYYGGCWFCHNSMTDEELREKVWINEAVDMVMEKINNMEEMTNEH